MTVIKLAFSALALHRAYPPKGFRGAHWKDKDGTFIRRSRGYYAVVSNNTDDISLYEELPEVTVTAKGKTSALEKVITGLSLDNSVKESAFYYLEKTGNDLSAGVT